MVDIPTSGSDRGTSLPKPSRYVCGQPLQKTSLNLLTGSFRLIVRSLNGFPRQSAVARVRPLTVSHILDKRCDLHNRRWGCPRDLGVALIQDLFNGLFSHPRFDLGIGAPLLNHLRCIAIGGIDRATKHAPEMIPFAVVFGRETAMRAFLTRIR